MVVEVLVTAYSLTHCMKHHWMINIFNPSCDQDDYMIHNAIRGAKINGIFIQIIIKTPSMIMISSGVMLK